MNNIIIIDDSQEFIQTFTNEANARNIKVAAEKSLAGLKKLLPSLEHKFAAVVLDIKCLLEDDQAKEDSSFIGGALKYLDSKTPLFPRFILTGDETEFKGLRRYHTHEKMFIKQPQDLEKLFQELETCIQLAEPLRIKRGNVEVFDAFDRGLISPNKEPIVLNIIKRYYETDLADFRGIIGDIREVHEEIYKSINLRNKAVIPDRFINGNGSPIFKGALYKHLEGNLDRNNNFIPTTQPYQDSTIQNATKFIHTACSEYLHGSSKTSYQISSYIVKALVNSLLELIIWSKQY